MSPTLADVYMITGLGITGTVYPHKYKGSSKQTGVRSGVGYKRYIKNYMCDGPLSDVEYRAFMNTWLCRFIFCGKANEPTLNHIVMAEDLAAGTPIPIGKYLLGSVYHMLHQTTYLMHTSQKISCVNGPWRFVQMWLQLYMHQTVAIDHNNQHFPSTNYKEGKPRAPKVAKLMEKLPPLCPSTKALANFLSSSSEVLSTLFGFHVQIMTT
jgi:hypothetical protein